MLRSGNLKGALAHLEVVDSWPQELSVGLNGSLMLRTVETLPYRSEKAWCLTRECSCGKHKSEEY